LVHSQSERQQKSRDIAAPFNSFLLKKLLISDHAWRLLAFE